LHWSNDNWQTVQNTDSTPTAIDIEFVDIAISSNQKFPINFTFFWTDSQSWENRNYQVTLIS
jgi:glucoamylase